MISAKSFIIALLIFFSSAAILPAHAKTWSAYTIDNGSTSSNGYYSSLALDGSAIIVSYYTNSRVGFAKSTDGGSNWTKTFVGSVAGYYSSITAASTNTYLIVFYGTMAGDLVFAKSTDGGSNWSTNTVDSTGVVGEYANIAVDGSSYIISYWDRTNDDLKFAKSTDGGSNWSTSTVDTTGSKGTSNSLAVAGSGIYIISYRDGTNTALKFAKTIDGGSNWTLSTVDNTENTGEYSSITTDSSGNYLIAYKGGSYPNDGSYIIKSTNGGASWGTRVLAYHNDDAPGYFNSIYAVSALDYLIYSIDGGYSKNIISESSDGGSTWTSTVLNNANSGGVYTGDSFSSTLKVDSSGNYYISWMDDDNDDFKLFKGITPDTTAPVLSITPITDPSEKLQYLLVQRLTAQVQFTQYNFAWIVQLEIGLPV